MERQEIVSQLNGITLRNIDLTGLTLVDELYKLDEERKELKEALLTYLCNPIEPNREHLIEEVCDNMQVPVSLLCVLGIGIEEIVSYWNTKHLEKLKSRPRKENWYERY